MDFYYLDADKRPVGPVSREAMTALKKAGTLSNDTWITTEGSSSWQPLGSLRQETVEISKRTLFWSASGAVLLAAVLGGAAYTLPFFRSPAPAPQASAPAPAPVATPPVIPAHPAIPAAPPAEAGDVPAEPDETAPETAPQVAEHELGEWYEWGMVLGSETARAWKEFGTAETPEKSQVVRLIQNLGGSPAEIPPAPFDLLFQGYKDGAEGNTARFKPVSSQTSSILPAPLRPYSVSAFGTGSSTAFPSSKPSGAADQNTSLEKVIAGTVKIQAHVEGRKNLGSGFFIAPGFVLTNKHVIRGADSIVVTTNDQKEFEAELVAKSPGLDAALLKISHHGHEILELRDSETVRVGEEVIAVGFPLFDYLSATTTFGRISSTDRSIDNNPCFQIDLSINHGNSGGPLVDIQGRVIGINTFGSARTNMDRFNFSIKMNAVKEWMSRMALLPQE